MKIINPADEKLITELDEDTSATLRNKFDLLRKGQKDWAAVPLEERASRVKRFAQLLDEHKAELAATLTSEMGKPITQSYNELKGAQARIKWLTENAGRYLSDEWMTTDGTQEKIVY
jgi:acyl-CoA reductase-like NAD-dependent aldehyde dehydrogenase